MEKIVDWLISIEKLAGDFYYEAAEYFKEDQALSKFLNESKDDETWHFHIMGSAKSQLNQVTVPDPGFFISESVKKRIETPFIDNLSRLRNNELTVEQLLDCIAESEFSEWNKIFLYVVNVLKQEFHQFRIAAARIQGHLGRIETFLKSFPYGVERLKEITTLEKVFVENILVVDDSDINLELMCALLEDIGNVDSASDGFQGLEKMKEKYYKLVISDIDMPGMDGMAFYDKAVQQYENLQNRFIFTSGHIDAGRRDFFKENEIIFLPKPCDIDEVLDAATRVINRP